MKKVAYFGMMALLCAVACQREAQIEDNPNYNPETKEVTTQFVMSVSTNNANAETRMTEADVQSGTSNSFRGMDRVHILTFTLENQGGANNEYFVYNPTTGEWPASSFATRDYDLSRILVKDEISASNSSKVMEMALPLQTNAVMIYGIAPKTKSDNLQGKVNLAGDPVGKAVSNISFSMAKRVPDMTGFNEFTDLLGRILTGILHSGCRIEVDGDAYQAPTQGGTVDKRYHFWWPIDETSKLLPHINPATDDYYADGTLDQTKQYTFHIGTQTWRDYALSYDKYLTNSVAYPMSPLEIRLGSMYRTITTIRSQGDEVELRAGSAQAVFRLSEDVYSMLLSMEQANISTWHDYIAMLVAKEIHDRAYEFFYQDPTTQKMTWRPLTGGGSIAESVDEHIPGRTFATSYSHVTDDFFNRGVDQPGFPMNLGLPSGAALMYYLTVPPQAADENQYEVVQYYTAIPAYGMDANSIPVANYLYPAELMYWTNSSLRTTTNSVSKESYPVTVTKWDNEASWASWSSNAAVQSTTRGVAVAKEINYGTALLKMQVKYGDNIIHDNNKGIHPSEADNEIDVANIANQFKVTGVIIGGAPQSVGWDFLPTEETSFSHLVYDPLEGQEFFIPTGKATSPAFYTMTWDNYNASLAVDNQSPVYVALEFQNNTGKDIWGGLNLIRKDGTFYIIGKLDPTEAAALQRMKSTLGVDADGNVKLARTNFNYPPYDTNGNTINAVRVFMQDYVTEVIFSFNKHSLRNAYVTMPDLRSSNVSLGLSVDLQWTPGLNFSNVPLGGVTSDAE
jgi:hypothetical protein